MRALLISTTAALAASGCAYTQPDGPWLAEDAAAGARQAADASVKGAKLAAAYGTAGAEAAHRHVTGPHLSAPGAMPMPAAAAEPFAPNSLWRAGSRSFFNDQRAARVGDILTVQIDISDSADLSNSTSRDRSGSISAGINALAGQERLLGRLLPPGGAFDPTNLVDADGQSQSQGSGEISRQENISLTVAAVVAEVLPNGNFVVSGRQEVRINAEIRDLTVSGVIRPEDIAADNTIKHTQMADARISYGGRGVLSTIQRPRWGQRVVDAVSPW